MFAYQENYLSHQVPCSPVTEEGSNNSHRDFQIRERRPEPSHSHRVVGRGCWPQQCPLSQRMLTERSPAAVKVPACDSPPLRPNYVPGRLAPHVPASTRRGWHPGRCRPQLPALGVHEASAQLDPLLVLAMLCASPIPLSLRHALHKLLDVHAILV